MARSKKNMEVRKSVTLHNFEEFQQQLTAFKDNESIKKFTATCTVNKTDKVHSSYTFTWVVDEKI